MVDATWRGSGGGSRPSRTFDSPAGQPGWLFKGEAGVGAFKEDLDKFLKHTLAFRTGETAPRLEYRDVKIMNFQPQARTY